MTRIFPEERYPEMHDEIRQLISKNELCVLATVSENKPHCSLMAYAADSECREFYMATSKDTRKFRNIGHNPCVSLLIDTRQESGRSAGNEAMALTVSGMIEEVSDGETLRETVRLILSKHPGMKDFLAQPDVAVLRVKAESFLLLKGISESHFEKI